MVGFASNKSEFGQSSWCLRKKFHWYDCTMTSLCFVQSLCIMNVCSLLYAERVCTMKKFDFSCILQNQSNITLLTQAMTFPKTLTTNMYSKQRLQNTIFLLQHSQFIITIKCIKNYKKFLKEPNLNCRVKKTSRFIVAFCSAHWMSWEILLKM